MAYYNGDNNQGYYDPYQNSAQEAPSMASALGSAAKTIALIGGLNLVGQKVASRISASLGQSIKKGVLGKDTKAFNIAQRLDAPTLGGILKETSAAKSAISWFKSTSIGKAQAARTAYLQPLKGKAGYATARIGSAFKTPATLAGAVGGVWARTALVGAPVSYAIDSALGITQKDLGLQKKALWDVPGQIGNAAKWFAYESAYSTAFGAAGPLAKAVGGVAAAGLSKVFGGAIGKYAYKTLTELQGGGLDRGFNIKDSKGDLLVGPDQFYKKGINSQLPVQRSNQSKTFATKVISSAMHLGRTARDTVQYMNRASSAAGQAVKEGIAQEGTIQNKLGKTAGPFMAALKNIKAIHERAAKPRSLKNTAVSSGGMQAVEFITLLSHQAKLKSGGGTDTLSLDEFRKVLGPEFGKLNRKTVVDHVHKGLKRTQIRDIASEPWIKDTLAGLEHKYAKADASILMDHVLNMNAGNHIFHGAGADIKGGGVNLAAFDPVLTMKRGLSFLTEHQWRVPLTKISFSIGDLTGWNDALAEKPNLMLFRNAPEFRMKDAYGAPDFKGVTVGDLAGKKSMDDNAGGLENLFIYANGKWGVFDGDSVKAVDSGRVLKFSRQHSKAKARETDWIRKQRLLELGNSAEEINKKLYGQDPSPPSSFLGMLRNNLQIPGLAKAAVSKLSNALGAQKHAFDESATKIFGLSDPTNAYQGLPDMKHLLQMQNQVFSRILHDKDSLTTIGEYCGSRFSKKSLADVIWDNNSIRDKYEALGLQDFSKWSTRKPDVNQAVEMIEAYPRQAEKFIVHKKLGIGSDMNSYDVARVALVDDVINSSFWNDLKGNGAVHPLLLASEKLYAKGKITKKEMMSLKLKAKLSAYESQHTFDYTGSTSTDYLMQKAVKDMRTHAKQNNWDVLNEIKEYTSNNQLLEPKFVTGLEEMFSNQKMPYSGNNLPFTSVPRGIGGAIEYGHGVADTLGDLLSSVSPLKRNPAKHIGLVGTARYMAKNALVIGGVWQGYRVADALVASTPLLDNTQFDEGITGFLSDNIAKARLVSARLSDALGITVMAKHMEGLMPKSTSTIPGAIAGFAASRALGGGIGSNLIGMAYGAVINRFANPYLPDATKSYEELKNIYSGKEMVPFMKSPTWLLGSTPWEGSKVEGFTPNWYVRAKSRWKETDTMYGSAFRKLIHEPIPLIGTNIGDVVDPYYMERKHFFTRPYPVTGEFGSEIPLIGGLVGATIGRIIKPRKTMHQEFLTGTEYDGESTYGINNPPPTLQQHEIMMNAGGSKVRDLGGRTQNYGTFVYGTGSAADTMARRTLMDLSNTAGLQGFLGRTAAEKLLGSPKVMPTLETAGRIASMSRSYYDLNLGGMGILTEPVRRMIQKPEYKRYGINPIPNMMPNWLPEQFLTGDPYQKIMKGELRLPGDAYMATHTNIKQDLPARASMIGGNLSHIVQYFTGLLPPVLKEEYDILEEGNETHAQIQDSLAAEGLLIAAEQFVVDTKNDITGHIDAIIRDGQGGRGRRALEIKTINAEGFEKLTAPKNQHVSQLNFYLKQTKMNDGTLLYVMRDNPSMTKTFNIKFNPTRWEKDVNKLKKARQVAADMMQEGVGDTLGYSYSWLDRLNILSDVAPSSKEFKEAKHVVELQAKNGLLSEDDILKYKNALKNRQTRIRKYELYPIRFKGKIMSPDTTKNIESINENIKAADQYPFIERVMGAMWESFTNTNTFVVNKLWAVKDPLEHYKMMKLYGREYTPWDEPYRSFIEPMTTRMLSKTDPFTGALNWAGAGTIFGGPFIGALGAVVGAGYGTVNGMVRDLTNKAFIPGRIQEQRDINSYFDGAKYARNFRLASLSNGLTSQEFRTASMATLTAFNQGEGGDVANLFRATPTSEKPYIEAWLNEKDPSKREEILSYVPTNLANSLRKQWSRADGVEYTLDQNDRNSVALAAGTPNIQFDASIFDPAVNLDDIKLKTIEAAGLDAHDFGLGWNEQQYRLLSYDNEVRAANMNRFNEDPGIAASSFSQGQIKTAIINALQKQGLRANIMVYINNYSDNNNVVNVTIKRDRSMSIINAVRRRQKWMN